MQKAIDSTKVNRNGGFCTPGFGYSAFRIAECIDTHHKMNEIDDKAQTISSFMSVDKIGSKDLATRVINRIECELEFKLDESVHQSHGAFSLTMGTDLLNIGLRMLFLQWPSRPIRSYYHQTNLKHNVDIVVGTTSN